VPPTLFLFLDGVGLGTEDPATNPLAGLDLPAFRWLAGGQAWTAASVPVREASRVFLPLDATLGVDGLPQSGTGQASLFTGINCAALAERHWGPYPHSTSRDALAHQSVFARLAARGQFGQFLNAYPERFFRAAAHRQRWTVTTRACLDAGVALRTEADLRTGRALAADLTGAGWRTHLGIDIEPITPDEAGRRFVALGRDVAFTLVEYFHTDKAGHAQDPAAAAAALRDIDRFLTGALNALDPARERLVVTSDHGNIEDLSVRTHTRNAVPLAVWGAGAAALAGARDLTDVVPGLLG